MSLTVKLKNIGIIKQAEFSLGDLTIICGENNTGKTYAAYALYGFLKSWHNLIRVPISGSQIQRSLAEGVEIESKLDTDQMLAEACKIYTEQLDIIFAANEGTFQNSGFSVLPDEIDIYNKEFKDRIESPQGHRFRFSVKCDKDDELVVVLGVLKNPQKEVDFADVEKYFKSSILNFIFFRILPRTFIFSSERTGVSIFRKELDYARNRLLDEAGRANKEIDPRQLLAEVYQSYPSPIGENVDFSRRLEDIAKNKSFIAKEHPEVLEDFSDIVGGEYAITQNDQLYFIPKDTQTKLTMVESSSVVRSLLDLSFYLRHIAEKGDLLMVDEPELSLHPENQRRIARLFARLVNLGIKVFITTHSDYIVKELNTLIMLNHDKPHLKAIAKANGYQENELIKAEQVKVYVAEKALMPLEKGQQKRRRAHTLVPADIDPEFGIEVRSFDKTIDTMNKIQRDIVWGAKQDK